MTRIIETEIPDWVQAKIQDLRDACRQKQEALDSRAEQVRELEARIAELEAYIGYWEGSDITTADYIKQLEQKLEAGWIMVCQSGLADAHDKIADLTAQLEAARKEAP